jgi:FPC/CPF motif-containing protein YcgG
VRTELDYLECAWLDPFDDDIARTHSQYYGYDDGALVRLLEVAPPTIFAEIAHATLREFVLDEEYPCLGARASFHRGTYRFGVYDRLDDPDVTRGLMRDVYAFANERRGIAANFTTFAAVFRGPIPVDELAFERALWSQLERLHAVDRTLYEWDPAVSSNPDDPAFSFSLAGNAFFVVGMHPKANRWARRFAWPALIFNAHEQFEELRSNGTFDGLQRRIRERDVRLQGSINANLTDYGRHSEAGQYSGREVEPGWKCPFHRPPEAGG